MTRESDEELTRQFVEWVFNDAMRRYGCKQMAYQVLLRALERRRTKNG